MFFILADDFNAAIKLYPLVYKCLLKTDVTVKLGFLEFGFRNLGFGNLEFKISNQQVVSRRNN